MATYRYVVVDVFTDTPLEGNQLGVFPDGQPFSDEQMQRIQTSFFLKGVAMTGAALLITQLGVRPTERSLGTSSRGRAAAQSV